MTPVISQDGSCGVRRSSRSRTCHGLISTTRAARLPPWLVTRVAMRSRSTTSAFGKTRGPLASVSTFAPHASWLAEPTMTSRDMGDIIPSSQRIKIWGTSNLAWNSPGTTMPSRRWARSSPRMKSRVVESGKDLKAGKPDISPRHPVLGYEEGLHFYGGPGRGRIVRLDRGDCAQRERHRDSRRAGGSSEPPDGRHSAVSIFKQRDPESFNGRGRGASAGDPKGPSAPRTATARARRRAGQPSPRPGRRAGTSGTPGPAPPG